jgi:hypothetical protein
MNPSLILNTDTANEDQNQTIEIHEIENDTNIRVDPNIRVDQNINIGGVIIPYTNNNDEDGELM